MALISLRATTTVVKPKARKKNWLGPSNATIMDRIITDLESYNLSANMDSTLEKTHKEIARQVQGMNRINRMNIPLVALVLAIRSNEERYEDYIDTYMRKIMILKDIPPEASIRDGLQIDIIRYNTVIDNYIALTHGLEYEQDEEEEEIYDDIEQDEAFDEE